MVAATAGAYAGRDTQVIGRRVLATIIDVILLGIVSGLLAAPGALIGGSDPGAISVTLSVVGSMISLTVAFAYFTLLEGLYGQTLGKMFVGVKVVREDDGGRPGIGKAALRTVLRIVDSIGNYLVAFVVALVSGKNQRLGDMAAKTLVVRA
jgi:uncharacterized RDD family membrane protein YckC